MNVLSDLIINPLIPQDKVDSELSNVDSEFTMSQNSNQRRLDDVLTESMDVEHPFKIFGTGNTQSLKDIFHKSEFRDDSKFKNRNALMQHHAK